MSEPATQTMTADSFIAWSMEQPEGARYELAAGHVVRMASERAAHARAKLRIAELMSGAVRSTRLPCEVFGDGMAVVVDENTVYEPDASLRCGAPLPGDAVKIFDPVIVVEVVSPSSRAIDSNAKLDGYFRLATVRHYLVVSTESRIVIHHNRTEAGLILARIVREEPIELDPPGIVLTGLFE